MPHANYLLVCLEKFPYSVKNCDIQNCYLAVLVLCLIVMKMLVYHFMRNSVSVPKSMSSVKIIS